MRLKLVPILGLLLSGLFLSASGQTTFISEDFSTATGSTAPAGWTNNTITGAVTDVWRFDNPGLRSLNSPISSPAAIFDSDNYSTGGGAEDVALESPAFNASATPVVILTFDHYFQGGFGGAYTVEVFNGTAWVSVLTGSISTANPASVTLDISPQAAGVTNAQVRFRWTGDYSWYWIMDNVTVFAPPATDATPVALTTPSAGCLTSTETITVTIANAGAAAIDFSVNPTTVFANIDNGTSVQSFSTTVSTGTLATSSSQDVVVTALADMAAAATYTIEMITTVAGAPTGSNDTLTTTIINTPTFAAPLAPVNFTGFTGANLSTVSPLWFEAAGFPPATLGSSWTSDDFANVANGANGISAKINLYTIGKNDWIIGPKFTPALNTVLSFDMALTVFGSTTAGNMGSDDQFVVYLSTDCGATFFPLDIFTASSTISNTGQYQEYPLGNYAGQTCIVGFFATEGTVNDLPDMDLFLDNIEVKNVFPVDPAVSALVSPSATGCLGATETISVEITNDGTSALDFTTDPLNISVVVSGPVPQTFSATVNTGTLAIGASQSFDVTTTADFSQAGAYLVDMSVSTPNDLNQVNDSLSASRTNVAAITVPLTPVTFLGFTGSNLPATVPGWIEGDGLFHPNILGSSDWTSDDFANVVGGPNGISAKVNLYNVAHTDWIISPKFTATANTVVIYDLAVTAFASTNPISFGSDDSLQVMVSTDCGVSYTSVKAYDASTPVSNTGQTDTVNLGSFAGQDIIVAFFAKDAPVDDPEDLDLFLDNILIKEVLASDIAAVSVDSLASSCGLGATEMVGVTFTNSGAGLVTDVLASFSVDGGAFTTPESAGAIAAGATVGYVFTATADLSAVGSHTITVVTTAGTPADLFAGNDTVSIVVNNIPVISSLPYSEDFENGTGGWTAEGTNSTWEFGTPAATTINAAASGVNAWVTNLTGAYNNNEQSAVVSPCFDMSNITGNVWVGFDLWLNSEFEWDGAAFQSSNDGGATWTNVGAVGSAGGFNWYNDDAIDGSPGGQQTGWTGGSSGWFRAYHPLDTTVLGKPEVRFRVAFGSDAFVTGEGIAFDNFAIGVPPVANLVGDTITACIGTVLDLGTVPGAVYQWSTGDLTQTITITNGTGSAITDSTIIGLVVDSLGFFAFDTLTINVPATAVVVTAMQTDEIDCFGDMDAVLEAMAMDGDAPYLYEWSNAATTASITGVGPGSYSVIVTDVNGCTTTDTVSVTEPPQLTVALDAITDASCPDATDGAITITTGGGTAPYSYAWDNGATDEDLAGVMPGDYVGTITDANGCVLVSPTVRVGFVDTFSVAAFTYAFTNGASADFSNGSSANATTFSWTFGDGGTSTDENPSYTYTANGSYTVTLIATGPCGSDTTQQTFDLNTVGIDRGLLDGLISMQPNPARAFVELDFRSLPQADWTVNLYSMDGKLIQSESLRQAGGNFEHRLNIPASVSEGVYMVQVVSSEGYWTGRLSVK
ncbi:MAG: PKD domain-containing protein [Bacteroidia bacterium]|nr:PKD domain-containing protein [Bacteroidia bacterium]